MQKVPELSSFYLLFFLFGQTLDVPSKSHNRIFKRIFSIVLKIVYLLVLISLAYWMTHSNIKSNGIRELTSILARVPFLFYILSNFVAVFSEWSHPMASQWLYNRTTYIILYTKHRVTATLALNRFKWTFYRKVLFALSEAIITFLVKSQLKSVIIEPITELILLMATIYRYVALFHMLLLIDLIAFILSSLNDHLKSINERPLSGDKLYATLRHLKWIHYNLFRVTRLLNER